MSFTAEHQSVNTFHHYQSDHDPLKTARGIYVTIHGHFYQPPRENPYLDTIERQPSAHPFHDWNQRIHFECYRPNAFARIVNDQNEAVKIVNNFEYISFNIGPTLMSWLQKYDLEVYQRILEADQKSAARLNGHGNAIAQVYNHIILPLANERDKYTQIRWGKADFRHRFGRDAEGMWLAETAVDYATVEALVNEGIKFIILAPSQAERCRPIPTEENPDPEWHEVGGGQIDPTRPYRCYLLDGRYLDIFFYDGPISKEMGFNDVLHSADFFMGRLGQAIKGDHRPSQLISVATDGETFGHHKMGTEKCITYCCTTAFPEKGWTVTNYAHYLSINPPSWEVVLKPVTAWSCTHGVGRWQDDCGCGGSEGWQQKWRRPLRDSLNWLRDQLIPVYEEIGKQYFREPWLARDEYIQVILDRSREKVEEFLTRHQVRQLSPAEQIDALRLLEMQRHSLLMFTSCGWFFEEISRPEGTQILRYAARAMELAAEISGIQLEPEFKRRLAEAPSNLDKYQDGADVYEKLVISSQISLAQVAAHYAISSLFNTYPQQDRLYCYDSQQLDYQKQQLGSLTLAVGQLRLTSEITWESSHFVFAVLHLGGWDFHCCIKPFVGRSEYSKIKEEIFSIFNQAKVIQTVLRMSQLFGNQSFSLQHLFAEERYRIMQQLTATTKKRLDQLYTQVYRDNYGILLAFQRDELPVPQELQVAAEVALSHRCLKGVTSLEQSAENPPEMLTYIADLEAIASEVNNLNCQLQVPEAKTILERLILRFLWQLLHDSEPENLEADIHLLIKLIEVGEQLHLELWLDKAQELYYNYLYQQLIPNCFNTSPQDNGYNSCPWRIEQINLLLKLGQKLAVNVTSCLESL